MGRGGGATAPRPSNRSDKHMQMDKYEYHKFLIQANRFRHAIKECNIFSIGGKGYYENPTSDILAFFLDPGREHGFRDLFITSLFEAAGYDSPPPIFVSSVEREVTTDTGSRIDLLIKSTTWSMVIENKMFHWLANPLPDYEKHIERNDGEKYFIVLSIKEEQVPPKWHSVKWESYLEHIKKKLGDYVSQASNVKWHVILREFIMNIENNYAPKSPNHERNEFVEENYSLLNDLLKLRQAYLDDLAEMGTRVIAEVTGDESISIRSSFDNNWAGAQVIRLFSSKWGKRTNIACVLRDTGTFYLVRYVYDIPDDKLTDLRKRLDPADEYTHKTESKTIRAFEDQAGYTDSKSAMAAVGKAAKLLNDYYSNAGQ